MVAEEPEPDLEQYFYRFFPQQREKVRLIDDFSICGTNSAFGMTEKLRVDSTDEIVATIAVLLDSNVFGVDDKGPCGRTFDLKSAYWGEMHHVPELQFHLESVLENQRLDFFKVLPALFFVQAVKVRGEVCTAVLNTLNLLEHL